MRKVFAILLLATSPVAVFAQAPAKAPSSAKAPELTLQQKNDLLKIQLKFINVGQQMNTLQEQAKTLQQQYRGLIAGMCGSSDGKTYQVELSEDPVCKEVLQPVKK